MTAEHTDLVRAAQSGSDSAFERLFHQHQERVYSLALHMLGDTETAEDVTQEAFVRAWQNLGRLRHERAFAGWVRRIALNLIWDRIRSRPPVDQMPEQAMERMRDPEDPPPERAQSSGNARRVREAVLTLPAHQRDVVALYYWEDLPVDEIAERMGLPRGTVVSRLHRGRETLRRKLHGFLDEEAQVH